MSTDDPTATALQRLGQAMDMANDLIGGLLRKVDDAGRPSLRVLPGRRQAAAPSARPAAPVLRVMDTPRDGRGESSDPR
jgi:hypothetical protein